MRITVIFSFFYFFTPLAIFSQIGVRYKIDLTQNKNISNFEQKDLKQQKLNPSVPEFDAENLPIFCKIEYKMEKKTKFPVRFRLGTLETVDRKEGK